LILFLVLFLSILLLNQVGDVGAQKRENRLIQPQDAFVEETHLLSTLAFQRKPVPGGTATATYTLKAVKDGVHDLVIHLEAGRLYTHDETGFKVIRYDLKFVNEPEKQMKTISLPSLKKGESYSTTFTVTVPKVDSRALAKLFPFPDRPIIAAWTTFKHADGKSDLDGKIGKLSGITEIDRPSLAYGNYFASLYIDTNEKPNEKNAYLHYFGPTDGLHGEDSEWIRNLERVREALDLPDDPAGRMPCVGLWDYAVEAAKREKISEDIILSRMAREVNSIVSKEKLTRFEAARKFLRTHAPSAPKTKSEGPRGEKELFLSTRLMGNWYSLCPPLLGR